MPTWKERLDLADKVAAALQASVLPSVIARGGEIRVLGVEDGTATLEIGGSPGASLPLLGRIEQLVRNAVPEIARVRLVGPGGEPQETPSAGNLADQVRDVLDREINPVIAAHRGHEPTWSRSTAAGSACTRRWMPGLQPRRGDPPPGHRTAAGARVPGVVELTDLTDHQAGRDPFYSAAKR